MSADTPNRKLRRSFPSRLILVALLATLPGAAGATSIGSGDDTAIFGSQTALAANVMILLDTSLSMNSYVDGSRKINTAKDVLTDLVNNVNPDDGSGGYQERARFGFAYFSANDDGDGAIISVPTEGGSKQDVLDAISNATPDTYTPLSEALVDVGRYFMGEHNTTDYPDMAGCDPNGPPTTGGGNVSVSVATSSDDVRYEYDSGNLHVTDGAMRARDDDVPVADGDDNGEALGLRFTNVEVPAGSVIVDAYIQLYVNNYQYISHEIAFEQADNPGTFSWSGSDFVGRLPNSSAPTARWQRTLNNNEWWNTPDLTTLVQDVVDRPGWASGNAMVAFLIPLHEQYWSADFRSYDYSTWYSGPGSYAPRLFITYTDPSAPPTEVCEDPRDQYKFPGTGSPIDIHCRQSFVIAITDGEPRNDLNDHYGAAVAGTTAWSDFVNTIGNADGDSSECAATGTACIDSPSAGRDDATVYSYDGTDWFDDVAYWLSHTDLVPALEDDQYVYTYAIGFAIDHALLGDAAFNGDGEYYTTSNAAELSSILSDIVVSIFDRTASFTSTAVPSSRTEAGDRIYTAYFSPRSTEPFWPGHLESYELDPTGAILDASGNPALDPSTGSFVEPRNPDWDAATELLSNTSRSIWTTDLSASPYTRIAFDASITEAQLDLQSGDHTLYPNWNASSVNLANEAELRDSLVNYVHGEDAFDEDVDGNVSELREEGVLGDIFHSSPTPVGTPTRALLGEEGYGKGPDPFFDTYENRDRVVYSGANDGMLHAFHAGHYDSSLDEWSVGTGEELFGYIPGQLLDRIKQLPLNEPRTQYYVDLTPVIAEAWLGDGSGSDVTKASDEWATVLLQGYRQGERGYLALDITDPEVTDPNDPHYPYPRLLWEVTPAAVPNLGDSWSEPIVTRVKVQGTTGLGDNCGNNDGDGDCVEVWVAIFGGGYERDANPNVATFTTDPNDANWTDQGKGIYMVRMDTGELLASVEVDPSGVSGPAEMLYSIPSSPAVLDLDFDGFADVVYVGDVGGQIWKWDISSVGVNSTGDARIDNWSSGVFFRTYTSSGWSASPSWYRQVFAPPAASFLDGKLILAFGTGERADVTLIGDDSDDADNNRFYLIRDDNPTGAYAFAATYYEDDLTDITNLASDNDSTDKGFFFVADESEKFLTNHQIFGGYVITTSFVPDEVSSSVATCDPQGGGDANLYLFGLASGLGFFDDLDSPGDKLRVLTVGAGFGSTPSLTLTADGAEMFVQTSAGQIVKPPTPPMPGSRTFPIYWRQNF